LQDEPYPEEIQDSYLLNLEWAGFTNEQTKGRSAPAKNFRNGRTRHILLGAFLLSFASAFIFLSIFCFFMLCKVKLTLFDLLLRLYKKWLFFWPLWYI
jgi:hypothetical protein